MLFRRAATTSQQPSPSSGVSDVALQPSPLDSVETMLDLTGNEQEAKDKEVSRELNQQLKKYTLELGQARAATYSTLSMIYGRGPNSLRYSASKQVVLGFSIILITGTLLALQHLCFTASICLKGDPSGPLQPPYDLAATQSLIPIGFILIFLIAPSAFIAAHQQTMMWTFAAFSLNALACAFLIVSAFGSWGLIPTMKQKAEFYWLNLSLSLRKTLYNNNIETLSKEMSKDAEIVGSAAFALGVITGILALSLFPLFQSQSRALIAGRVKPEGVLPTPYSELCCSLSTASSDHDAAFGEGDGVKYISKVISDTLERVCPGTMAAARLRAAEASAMAANAQNSLLSQQALLQQRARALTGNANGGLFQFCNLSVEDFRVQVLGLPRRHHLSTSLPSPQVPIDLASTNGAIVGDAKASGTALATTISSSSSLTSGESKA